MVREVASYRGGYRQYRHLAFRKPQNLPDATLYCGAGGEHVVDHQKMFAGKTFVSQGVFRQVENRLYILPAGNPVFAGLALRAFALFQQRPFNSHFRKRFQKPFGDAKALVVTSLFLLVFVQGHRHDTVGRHEAGAASHVFSGYPA